MKYTIILIIALISGAIGANPWMQGSVIKVSDGDTFQMMVGGEKQKIRLYGIDCPESKQPFGAAATHAVDSLIMGRTVKVQIINTDRYQRLVGDVWVNDSLNLNQWLVAHGYAWWYPQYGKERRHWKQVEAQARAQKLGLWADDDPTPPWEWRKNRKSAPASPKKAQTTSKKKSEVSDLEELAELWSELIALLSNMLNLIKSILYAFLT